jgi:radical SAM protein with 4Fe4S-binding SPASM domain
LLPLRCQVRTTAVREDRLSPAEFKSAVEEMIRYKAEYGINFTTALGARFKGEIMPDNVFARQSSCAAGREGTNLDFDSHRGKMLMYGCSYCSASDLRDDSPLRPILVAGEFPYEHPEEFDAIWSDSRRWRIFRDLDLKPRKCQACGEFRSSCTGACPIETLGACTDLTRIDDLNASVAEQMLAGQEWYCYES